MSSFGLESELQEDVPIVTSNGEADDVGLCRCLQGCKGHRARLLNSVSRAGQNELESRTSGLLVGPQTRLVTM